MFCKFGFDEDKRPVAVMRLVERRVYPPRTRIDLHRQGFYVGGKQFPDRTVFQDIGHDSMVCRQVGQHLFGGGPLAGLRLFRFIDQRELFKQDIAQLFRGVQVKTLARGLVNALFDLLQLRAELLLQAAQFLPVHPHARAFHVGQHRDERDFQFVEQFIRLPFGQHRGEHLSQLQGHIRILAGVFFQPFGVYPADVLFPAHHFLEAHRVVRQIFLSQDVHPVAGFGVDQVMRHHRIEQFAAHRDPVIGQHFDIVFQVLSRLGYFFVLKNRAELFQHRPSFGRVLRHPHPVRLSFFQRERQTDQAGIHRHQ